jgi:hypothetical protein
MMATEPGQRPQGCQHRNGNDAQAAPGKLPQLCQHRNDASAATATRASNVVSIAMATMPKWHWQWRQLDDYNDTIATMAMMAMAPGQRPQGQHNACIIASEMLAMTPVATLPRKGILHNDFATMGNFAKDGSFAKEGNFTAEGNVAEGG